MTTIRKVHDLVQGEAKPGPDIAQPSIRKLLNHLKWDIRDHGTWSKMGLGILNSMHPRAETIIAKTNMGGGQQTKDDAYMQFMREIGGLL
ncbi:unnamed protein product [Timema podura]|uniref:Uncharacterized protein n=1 Tax=Timema podura TaxID=61482 RepID=A0ABN7NZI4_TIMPD|nr:unnamed protein product [Timema podura]